MDIFRALGARMLSVTTILNFPGKANTSINGLGEDDTATLHEAPVHVQRLLTLAGSRGETFW